MSMVPDTRGLVEQIRVRPNPTHRLGIVTNMGWAFKPPIAFVDTGGGAGPSFLDPTASGGPRQMRFASNIYPPLHTGDTVLYVDNGAAPFILCRLHGDTDLNGDWQTLTYSGSWVAFGAPYETGRYWKDPDGFVYVQLVAKNGALGTTIATLPSGYRPWSTQHYQGLCGPTSTGCRIDIDTAGNITMIRLGSGGNNTFVSLVCRFQESLSYNSSYPQWTPVPWFDTWNPINSFDNYPQVHVRDDGFCQMHGGITGGTNSTGGIILPEYARSRYEHVMSIPGLSGAAYQALRADVHHSSIQPVIGSNTEDYLDSITWYSRHADHTFLWTGNAGSWVPYDPVFAKLDYMKDKFGVVHLRGLSKNGTAGTTMANLGVGFRPGKKLIFPAAGDALVDGRVDVNTDGTVVHVAGGTGYISTENIFFQAEL